jgi:hypothetical protein
MDIAHQVLPEHKLVYVVVRGKNTITDIMQYILDLPHSDGQFIESADYLIDTRHAEASGETTVAERQRLKLFVDALEPATGQAIKTATVLPSGALEYGLSRMYGAEMERSAVEYQLFDDFEKAIAWLGRPQSLVNELRLD